jgi:hypothetical protein
MNIRTAAASRLIHQRFQCSCQNFFRRLVVLGAGLLLLALPYAAFADEHEDDDPFDRPGFYLGVGGSYQHNVFESAIEDAIDDEFGVAVNVDLEDSGGVNAVAGYRVASFFAIELEYEWVSEYDVELSSVVGYSIEGHTLTANTKWIIPFWRIQPYFLLGGGLAISDVSIDSTTKAFLDLAGINLDDGTNAKPAGRAGLGFDLYITENILVNTEVGVVLTTLKEPDLDDLEDLNYMSIQAGLQYRF